MGGAGRLSNLPFTSPTTPTISRGGGGGSHKCRPMKSPIIMCSPRGLFAFLDAASGQEGDSHRLEVAFADSSDFHCANAVVGVVMTRELGRHIPLAVERHDVDQSCGTYSGKRLNASEQLLLQGPALFL